MMGSEGEKARDSDLEAAIGRAMLAQSQDCVKLLNIDGSLRFMNEAGRCLLEIEPGAVPIGQHWSSLWPEESRTLIDRAISVAANGGMDRFAALAPTARGKLKWWDVVITPIQGADGSIDGLLSVSRDITQEKMSDAALRTSEQRFRGLADNMAQLAWMADAEGRVFWYNKRWLDYAGVTTGDMSAFGWHRVHHPDYADRIRERMAAAFERREMWEDQIPLRAADGTYRWFLSRAVPVTDDSGRLALWCATHTDITEQRNLSHRLRQLARVVELSHEAILVWDLEGGIALWNNGCEELYGFSRTEAIGKRSHDLLSTDHTMGVEAFESLLRKNGEWSGEIRHRAKDGSEIWVDSRQELIRAGGRNLVIETNRDITERRKADELRELLVAELNHRVKNTLAIVQSIAAQMARSQPSLPDFMARFSGRIQSLAISQSILSDAHWSGAELADLIRSQISLISPGSEQLQLEGPPVMVPPELALQLTLIIHELATNASRHGAFARPEGVVHVTWSEEPAPQSRIVIDWRETGGPPVTASSGYGFGRHLIERTGRLPHLRTELQLRPEGARCRIVLDYSKLNAPARGYFKPVRHIANNRKSPPSTRPARMAGRRILLIEEDPLESSWIEEALADAGFLIVGLARTTEAALSMIETAIYDTAIVDRTGRALDAALLLERLDKLGKPSIALASTEDQSSTGQVLTKPLDARSLIRALHAQRRES
jgi:PAS domain S-box-containing protein